MAQNIPFLSTNIDGIAVISDLVETEEQLQIMNIIDLTSLSNKSLRRHRSEVWYNQKVRKIHHTKWKDYQ